jgi:hypothetical protein
MKDKDGNIITRTGKPTKKEIDAFQKESAARFARLGVVTNILRGERRDRYDWFLNNGFPKWRGTGYYYQRYRPGAATVLVGLFIIMGGFAHYGALVLGWKRQREFATKYIKDARKMAWGNNMVIPGLDTAAPIAAPAPEENGNSALNRRQKRMQEKENKKNAKKGITTEDISEPQEPVLVSGPQGTKRRVVAENGKVLIVDSVGNVFVEESTEEGETHEYLIDVSPPSSMRVIVHHLTVYRSMRFTSQLCMTPSFSVFQSGPGTRPVASSLAQRLHHHLCTRPKS